MIRHVVRRRRWASSSVGATPKVEELTVSDVMVSRGLRLAHEVDDGSSVMDAVRVLTERRAGSALTMREDRVSGVFTARDVLRWVAAHPEALGAPVNKIVTAADKIAWCAPSDSLQRVRIVMRALGVRNLPVVSDGAVLGMLTAKDVADFSLERAAEPRVLGGKELIRFTKGRSGLVAGVANAETRKQFIGSRPQTPRPHRFVGSRYVMNHHQLDGGARLGLDVGATALPNPFKRRDGTVANRRRDYGPREASDDPLLSEDAHFIHHDETTYVGVFDGVGSWRKVGVDPRLYPRALADACVAEIKASPVSTPQDILMAAWRRVSRDQVPGSSTACLATIDDDDAISYVNLGDAGLVVLRDTPDKTDKAIVLVAPQQLRDFNLPYQLGWTNTTDDDRGATATFETPTHANVATYPVHPGDIVLVASDGLFDNVAVDEIADLVHLWERENPHAPVSDLADILCRRARDFSLDEHRDSPFALLAKENDIMWGGGMPDDVTVVAMRVVPRRRNAE
ncbi:hypothetical protein CTAYLR_006718 [Chrysophaeum taylorii]|uniref:Protein phosphatase n=1 Tax=Chrysophaeum taylorii TaxID=2483200 RepID=A0AAD7XHD4_9STRA|nr:hypothetical protein CTAYLR_006718 [Chrysophaeum taylorii]